MCWTLLHQVKRNVGLQDDLADIDLGRLEPESMITGKIQMNEVEEKGFKALIHNKDNHVKILVEVTRERQSKL